MDRSQLLKNLINCLYLVLKNSLSIPKSEKEFKQSYTIYENWVREMIKTYKLEVVTPTSKRDNV